MTVQEIRTLDITDDVALAVPRHPYENSLDLVMDERYYVRNCWKRKEKGEYGTIHVSVVPIIEIMLDHIMEAYGKTNGGDFYSNMASFGHTRIQHRYHLNYRAMRTMKKRIVDAGKLNALADAFKRKEQLFQQRVEGGRERMELYVDRESVIAPTVQYRKCFNITNSDLAQVYLCEAIMMYPSMQPDNKEFFLEALGDFDERVKTFFKTVCEI